MQSLFRKGTSLLLSTRILLMPYGLKIASQSRSLVINCPSIFLACLTKYSACLSAAYFARGRLRLRQGQTSSQLTQQCLYNTQLLQLVRLQADLVKGSCGSIVLTALDEIAWLFNLRGADIAHNPGAVSCVFI